MSDAAADLGEAEKRAARVVLEDFFDQILSPSLSVLLTPPEEDSPDSTGSLVVEWLSANGYQTVASSLQDAMGAAPPTTTKAPHKNRLETRLLEYDARFQRQRAMIKQIYDASVSILSLLQVDTPEIAEEVNGAVAHPPAAEETGMDVDGEPVAAPASEQTLTVPAIPAAKDGEALNGHSDKGQKRSRRGSLSDYSSPEPPNSAIEKPVLNKPAAKVVNDNINTNMVCKRNGKGEEGCTRPTCHFRHCSPAWRREMGVAMVPTELICPSERINLGMPTPCIDAYCKLAHRSAGFYRPELDVQRREKVAYGQGNVEPTSTIARKHPYEVWCKRKDDCKLQLSVCSLFLSKCRQVAHSCMFRHPRDGVLKVPGA